MESPRYSNLSLLLKLKSLLLVITLSYQKEPQIYQKIEKTLF